MLRKLHGHCHAIEAALSGVVLAIGAALCKVVHAMEAAHAVPCY